MLALFLFATYLGGETGTTKAYYPYVYSKQYGVPHGRSYIFPWHETRSMLEGYAVIPRDVPWDTQQDVLYPVVLPQTGEKETTSRVERLRLGWREENYVL